MIGSLQETDTARNTKLCAAAWVLPADGGTHRIQVDVLAADGHEDLADGDAGGRALRLTEGAAHARLQPIRAGARQHLVDAQHVERVHLRGGCAPSNRVRMGQRTTHRKALM